MKVKKYNMLSLSECFVLLHDNINQHYEFQPLTATGNDACSKFSFLIQEAKNDKTERKQTLSLTIIIENGTCINLHDGIRILHTSELAFKAQKSVDFWMSKSERLLVKELGQYSDFLFRQGIVLVSINETKFCPLSIFDHLVLSYTLRLCKAGEIFYGPQSQNKVLPWLHAIHDNSWGPKGITLVPLKTDTNMTRLAVTNKHSWDTAQTFRIQIACEPQNQRFSIHLQTKDNTKQSFRNALKRTTREFDMFTER